MKMRKELLFFFSSPFLMRKLVNNAVSGYTLNEGRWKIEPFYF